MASESTFTREMAEAAWRYLWSQKRWAVEDVQEAIRHAFVVLERTHVVVPRKPTEAMIEAGEEAFRAADQACAMEPAEECYRAMLAASTEPTTT